MLSAEPTSVSTKPSVSHAEASLSVLVFSVTVIKDTSTQTLNCPIEHHVEEELKLKHQNSIRLTSLIHLCSTRPVLTPFFQAHLSMKTRGQLYDWCPSSNEQMTYQGGILSSPTPISFNQALFSEHDVTLQILYIDKSPGMGE